MDTKFDWYIRNRLSVIPLCSFDHEGMTDHHKLECHRQGKCALIQWKDRGVPTLEEAQKWSERWPGCNVGMLLGGTTRLMRVDVDGEGGSALLDEMSGGDMPPTWTFRSGQGFGYLYVVRPGVTLHRYSKAVPGAQHEECSLLVNGYTVLPPSVHANGDGYAWLPGRAPWEIECADAPDWVVKRITGTEHKAHGETHERDSFDKLAVTCPNLAQAIVAQKGRGLDEPKWFSIMALLVRLFGLEEAMRFSRLSQKHNQDSEQRIRNLAKRADEAGPPRCETLGCGEAQLKACFNNVQRDVNGFLLGHPGWHLSESRKAHDRALNAERVAWEAVRQVTNGENHAAHLSKQALQAFNHVESQNPPEFAKMEVELKAAKVSLRNWNRARKATEVRQESHIADVRQSTLPPFEESGITLNSKTGSIGRFNENIFARHVANKFDLGIKVDQERMYRYAHGVWKPLALLEVSRLARDYLHELVAHSWTLNLEKRYIPALYRGADLLDHFDVQREYINLRNGMLNLSSMSLMPHDKRFQSTIQVGITFDPDATCERFLHFLSEVLEGDDERIALVQEMFGYCLTAETRAHKAFFLYGGGRNGKSVLLDILTAIVGQENCSAVPMSELENDFARSDLYGKTVNLTTENEVDPRGLNTTYFKSIVSGDPIRANVKYEKAFTFRPTVKLVFAANNLPYSRDRSSGFLQRTTVIPFNRQFLGSEANKHLTAELLEELPGVLNWALHGLKRLRKNAYMFTDSEIVKAALNEFRANLSPVFAFAHECFTVNPDRSTTRKTIREGFVKWCRVNGHEASVGMSHKRFWASFRTACREKGIDIADRKSNGIDSVVGVVLKSQNRWDSGDWDGSEEMAKIFEQRQARRMTEVQIKRWISRQLRQQQRLQAEEQERELTARLLGTNDFVEV